MFITTLYSTIVHGSGFLAFGGGIFLAISRLTDKGKLTADNYLAIIIMFALCMFHCLTLIFLLDEKRSFKRRTYGYSVVTAVLEVIGVPVYTLFGLGFYNMPYGFVLLIFAILLFISLVGNIYCIIRHTLTK